MNRYTTRFIETLQKGVYKVYCRVTFAAAGAPTIDRTSVPFNSQGLVSVTRNGAGLFTFVFGTQVGMLDVMTGLLGVHVFNDTTGAPGAPAAPLYYLSANAVSTPASCSLQLTFNSVAQAATDPASGEAVDIEFTFKTSNAP